MSYCQLVSTKEIDDLRQNVKEQDQNNITENVFKDVSFYRITVFSPLLYL
jgi:hypothetical protein